MKKEPTLVTLMGDQFPDLSFMDESDLNMLMGACDLSDDSYLMGVEDVETYLNQKYPEYMGIWGKIIKGIGKFGKKYGRKIGKGLFRRIRARRAKRKGGGDGSKKRMQSLQAQLALAQKQKMLRDQKAKKDQQNKMAMGLAAAAAAAVALL